MIAFGGLALTCLKLPKKGSVLNWIARGIGHYLPHAALLGVPDAII